MTKDEQTIKDDIKGHISHCGGTYSAWYVGITETPRERVFQDHKVKEKTDAYIWRKAESANVAGNVEDYFVNTLCTDGGTGGGTDSSDFVYAYKKNSHTDP